jgi:rod shape-determining protein MreC
MLKKNKNTITTVVIGISLVLLLTYSLNIIRNTNIVEYSIKYFSDTVMNAISFNISNDGTNVILSKDKDELQSEVDEMKKILGLKDTYTNYELENATVAVRNKSYWLDTLIIDKGKENGVRKNMAVITKDGLIGNISKVYNSSSEVRLITTNNNKQKLTIYIETDDGDYVGYIDKYDKDKKLLVIKDIDKDSNIKEESIVKTSGMNREFPKGIYIGKVKSIEMDKDNLSKILYVETNQNLNKIHYVAVVKKVND